MLKAARAQGRPMMVMAMMTAASSHAAAIHTPPRRSQRRFSKMETGGMRFLPGFEGSAFAPGGFADPMTMGRIIKTELRNFFPLSFRGDAKRRTRNDGGGYSHSALGGFRNRPTTPVGKK